MSPADDETWTWSVDDRTTELADFSGQPRAWSSVVLAVAGIVTLAVLVICVVIVANDSTRPPHVVPLSVPPLPTTAAPAPTMQSSVPGSPMAYVRPSPLRRSPSHRPSFPRRLCPCRRGLRRLCLHRRGIRRRRRRGRRLRSPPSGNGFTICSRGYSPIRKSAFYPTSSGVCRVEAG